MNLLKKYPLAFIVFLLLFLLWCNTVLFFNNCFNNFDLGIYTQAIFDIAGGISFNPILTTHGGYSHFGIHFDPAVYLAVPFAWIFGFNPYGMIVFEWLVYCSPLFIVYKLKFLEQKEFFFFALYYILARGLILAVSYPIHVSFWSLPLWTLLPWFFKKNNFKAIALTCLILPFFKESYPFAIFSLSFYYALSRKWKESMVILSISLVWIVVCFLIRPSLIDVVGHGHDLVEQLLTSPIEYLVMCFQRNLQTFFPQSIKILLPFVMIFWIVTKNRFFLPLFFMMMPLFIMQFLYGHMNFQYSFPFVIICLMIYFLSDEFRKILFSRKLYYYGLLLVSLSFSTYPGKRNILVQNFITKGSDHCVISWDHYRSTNTIKNIVHRIASDQKILATGGIITTIMRPGMKIYHLNSPRGISEGKQFSPKEKEDFDFILLEKNKSGDTWPLKPEKIEQFLATYRERGLKVIYEDNFYYLAEI